ncbi:MAG TPA: Panacea domain-containing protein [Chthoniobacterales bacterium]
MKSVERSSFPFDGQKATEAAALFLSFSGRQLNVMKLVKLMYLLDRESIARRGVPVVGGVYLSMRNGPVTSELLDLINSGELWHCHTNWAEFISDRQDHEVSLIRDPGHGHLSEFEFELIAELHSRFEKADQWSLRDFCHAECGEWLPLQEGCERISLDRLAEEVGRRTEEVCENAAQQSFLAQAFG